MLKTHNVSLVVVSLVQAITKRPLSYQRDKGGQDRNDDRREAEDQYGKQDAISELGRPCAEEGLRSELFSGPDSGGDNENRPGRRILR